MFLSKIAKLCLIFLAGFLITHGLLLLLLQAHNKHQRGPSTNDSKEPSTVFPTPKKRGKTQQQQQLQISRVHDFAFLSPSTATTTTTTPTPAMTATKSPANKQAPSPLCESYAPIHLSDQFVCSFGRLVAVIAFSNIDQLALVTPAEFENMISVFVVNAPELIDSFFSPFPKTSRISYLHIDTGVTGEFPLHILEYQDIFYIFLAGNPVTATLTHNTPLAPNLTFIEFSGSNISGPIPDTIFELSNIRTIKIIDNKLMSGTISTLIGKLTTLSYLAFARNDGMIGTIPSQIGCLPNLVYLAISSVHFVGTIPSQIGLLTNLRTLDLSYSQLTGSLPTQFGSLTALKEFQIASNKLQGSFVVDSLFPSISKVECDFSGLKSELCKQVCDSCPVLSLLIRPCDSQGYHQQCVPAYLLLPLLVVYIALVAVALKRVSPPHITRNNLIRAALMTSLAIAVFAVDFACAVNLAGTHSLSSPSAASGQTTNNFNSGVLQIRIIGYVSLIMIAVSLVVNFAISIAVINMIVTEVRREDGEFVNREFRERIFDNTSLLALTLSFCALSIRTLPFITGKQSISLLSKLRPLREGRSRRRDDSEETRSATISAKEAATTSARATTTTTTAAAATSAAAATTREEAVEGVKMSAIVGVVSVIFENVPQCVLQITALAMGRRVLIVMFAIVLSLISIVLEVCILPVVREKRERERILQQQQLLQQQQQQQQQQQAQQQQQQQQQLLQQAQQQQQQMRESRETTKTQSDVTTTSTQHVMWGTQRFDDELHRLSLTQNSIPSYDMHAFQQSAKMPDSRVNENILERLLNTPTIVTNDPALTGSHIDPTVGI